jgi:hypothetical protein
MFFRPAGGWPTLNDNDGPLGYADAIVIRDRFGTTVDSVAYRQDWSSPGVSTERIDPRVSSDNPANWSPHYGSSRASPGSPNSVSFHLPTAGELLSLSCKTFSPNGDGKDDLVAVSLSLPDAGLVRLTVFDINGRSIKRLIDGDLVDAGRVTFWDGHRDDGSEAAMGVYLVMLEARLEASDRTYRAKAPLILVRR